MATSFTLDAEFELFVQAQIASGRYVDADEVLRDALRLMKDRERDLADLSVSLARGVADADAGRVEEGDELFDRLERKYLRLAENQDAT